MKKQNQGTLKNLIITTLLIVTIFLFGGCSVYDSSQPSDDNDSSLSNSYTEEELAQKDFQEYLMSTFDLALDDLDKVNMYDLNKAYGDKRDYLNKENIYTIIDLFRNDYDMHYLLNNVAEPMFETFPLLEDIRYIYLFENIGSRFKTAIFDFENSQVTYDENGDVGYYYTTSPKKEFTQTEQELLVDILSNGTSEWGTSSSGTNGDTTGHHTWRIVIQLRTREIYRYSGYGIIGGKPKNFDEVVNSIWQLIHE